MFEVCFCYYLGNFHLFDRFLWCLCLPCSLFYLLARSLRLAALARGISQTFRLQLPPLRPDSSGVTWGLTCCLQTPAEPLSQASAWPSRTFSARQKRGVEESLRYICFGKDVSSGSTRWGTLSLPAQGAAVWGFTQRQDLPTSRLAGVLTWDDKALFVNMLLICNFENKIETSCILKYKMKCDALYTI